MTPDPSVWYQRKPGGAWYKIGGNGPAYRIRNCEGCGGEALMQASSRFCSHECAADDLKHPRTDTPAYRTVHGRMWKARGKASQHPCADCGEPAHQWSYDGQDPEELTTPAGRAMPAGLNYSAKPEHYVPRCVRCHKKFDGHLGETHGSAKLTEAQKRGIRASTLRPRTPDTRELAERFGVHRSTIANIRKEAS